MKSRMPDLDPPPLNLLTVADSELELQQAMRELEAAVGRLNAAMLRASYAGMSAGAIATYAGMSAGAIASMTGLSLGRVYLNVRAQQKGKP
jgi:hypothetical protein